MKRPKTKHPALRAYLHYLARTNPSAHVDVFRHYTEQSLREMRKKNFYLGGIFRARRGPYTILWIDPTTFEMLVVHRKEKKAFWKPFYGFYS